MDHVSLLVKDKAYSFHHIVALSLLMGLEHQGQGTYPLCSKETTGGGQAGDSQGMGCKDLPWDLEA